MELDFASLGSAAASALPIPFASQLGSLAGTLVGKVGGLFGGGQQSAAGSFVGLHSMQYTALDEASWNKGDADLVASWAKKLGSTVEDVVAAMAADAANTGHSAQYVWDAYAANGGAGGAASVRSWAAQVSPRRDGSVNVLINEHGTPKISQLAPFAGSISPELVPTSQRYAGLADQLMQSAPVPTSLQSNLTGDDLKKAAKAGYNGAIKGVSDVLLDTPEGHTATNEGAKQFVSDNGLIIGVVLSALVGLIGWLIATRKPR